MVSGEAVVAATNSVLEVIRRRLKNRKKLVYRHDGISRRTLGATNNQIWELLIKGNASYQNFKHQIFCCFQTWQVHSSMYFV